MILIHKTSTPMELRQAVRELQRTPDATVNYESLDSATKKAIRRSLLKEQGHLRAYCMSRIGTDKHAATIEHIKPQHPAEDASDDLDSLDYGNMLAVCDGRNSETCDKHRGNQPMKINPINPDHIATISYTAKGTIESCDPEIHRDITETLNLNSQHTYLRQSRKQIYDSVTILLQSEFKKQNIDDNPTQKVKLCEEKLSLIDEKKDMKDEFVGVKIFLLKKLRDKFSKQSQNRHHH